MTSKPEPGPNCPNCNQPVLIGQIVINFHDAGEIHADCANPYSLKTARMKGDPDPVVLLDTPMKHFPVSYLTPFVLPDHKPNPKPYLQRLLDTGEEMLVAFSEGVEWTDEQRKAYEDFSSVVREERSSTG